MEEKRCSKCGEAKLLSDFYKRKSCHDGYNAQCKKCINTENRKVHHNNINRNTDERIKFLEDSGITKKCVTCKIVKPLSEFNVHRTITDGHSEYCIDCSKKQKNYAFHNHKTLPPNEYRQWRNLINEKNMQEKRRLKNEVFSHYCLNGIVKCANPYQIHKEDVTDLDLLSLDHINGDGYKYRDKITHNGGGVTYYRFVKTHGYPSGLQVLCFNCQIKKKFLNKEYGEKYKQERAGY